MFPDVGHIPVETVTSDRRTKKRKKKSGKPSYRFVDKIRVRASAGSGGKGSASLHHIGRKRKVRPDGGHGGDGGSVLVYADTNEQSLRMASPHFQAPDGTHGSGQDKFGRKGKNAIIRVPCGVIVKRVLDYNETWNPETREVTRIDGGGSDFDALDYMEHYKDYDDDEPDNTSYNDADGEDEDDAADFSHDMVGYSDVDAFYGDYNNEEEEHAFGDQGDREKVVLADLEKPGDYVVVARGGKGGYGSGLFSSLHGGLPDPKILAKKARPDPGEVAFLELELKLIADIGLVGFPNAGKSSLLCAMSRAGPQVAPYPFTTLNPFIGIVEYRDGFRLKAADIPGLIDGASEGRGKGHAFLRHVERTKALLFIVDAAGTEGRDPIEDLKILANELASYGDGDMMNRDALVVANKLDLLDEDQQLEVLFNLEAAAQELDIKMHGDIQVHGISAGVTGTGLSGLSQAMRNIVLQSKIGSSSDQESS